MDSGVSSKTLSAISCNLLLHRTMADIIVVIGKRLRIEVNFPSYSITTVESILTSVHQENRTRRRSDAEIEWAVQHGSSLPNGVTL